jgi:hypothetical protein
MIVFYQNDRTGKFVTHKQRYRPEITELTALANEINADTGLIGIIDRDGKRHFFLFEHKKIRYEIHVDNEDTKLISKNAMIEDILTLYQTSV